MSTIQTNTLMSVDSTFSVNVKDVKPIGVGQTWQDVTADRAIDVEYTNDTGRPIVVALTGRVNPGAWHEITLSISGIGMDKMGLSSIEGGHVYSGIKGIVPAGGTYIYTYSGEPNLIDEIVFSELR